MWFNRRLQLLQARAGNAPGWHLASEKWVSIKFVAAYLSAVTPSSYQNYWENMAEFPVMGRYFIESNDTGAPNSSYVLGRHAAKENKVWRYNPNTLELYFGTLETWTGTQENGNQNTTKIVDDVVLWNVILTKKGFERSNSASGDHSGGFVQIESWTKQPFEKRSLFWTSI